jgi:hypothetical protein
MYSLLVHPACIDALMALSVLDSIISSRDANERIIKAMDEVICINMLKQGSIKLYFKKQ